MSAEYDLKPYRVEWQHNRVTTWVLGAKGGYDSHDEAREAALKHVADFGGFARVVVQHVIERVSR